MTAPASTSPDRQRLPRAQVAAGLAGATLRTRLRASFVIAAAVLAIAAVVSVISFTRLLDARRTALDKVDPANIAADQLFEAYLNQETGVRGYVLSGKPVFLQPYLLGLRQEPPASHQLETLLAQKPALLSLARKAEAQAVKWQDTYAKPAVESVSTHRTQKYASQTALLNSKSLFDGIRSRFAQLDTSLAATRVSADHRLRSATSFLIGLLVVLLILLLLAGIALSRALHTWVTSPLRAIAADARAVAAGDLTRGIEPSGPPDFRDLAADIEAMRNRITVELRNVDGARAELALRNVELSRSNVELEQFAYVASHDLQEPLRKVASFVQLLEQRYKGELDERADQYIAFAVDGAKRMQALINDLLAFSRVGRTTERLEQIDLASSVQVALANLRSAIEESDAEVQIGALPTVFGDPGLLASLWQNLIGNAIKFRSADSPLITIEATRSGAEWTVSITDNGIGIEPRFEDKVFVIFQRLHSREAYEGTGIGLALCKKIVEFHGGRIWLDLGHQPGTRISFTLPASRGGQ